MKHQLRSELGVREPVQCVTVLGIRLAYSDPDARSSLPIVICLHAIGHGGRDFDEFRSHFSKDYRIITLDWPGQGNSDDDHEAASVSRYTELFTNFVGQLKLEKFFILGNSIGGGVAIRYASENPEKVKALILCNPAGLDQGGFFARIFIGWIERRMRSGTKKEESFRDWFKRYYHKVLITDESADERERIIASAYEIAPILEQAWRSFRMPEGDLRSLIPQVKMPVLFAWAEKDGYVQWSRCKEAVEKFVNRKVVLFKAGHAPFLETSSEFNTAAELFFNSLKR